MQRTCSKFSRDRLPTPVDYFDQRGIALVGRGEWRSTICPFHADRSPSLRVNVTTGGFRCMVCGTHGGDVLAFHQQMTGLSFKAAARELGAWEGGR